MQHPEGVLVAGSDGGIGRACIDRLRLEGRSVVGVDRTMGIDITQPGGAEAALDHAEASVGTISGLVHAIGMSGRSLGDGAISECTDEAWREVLRVNTESVFRLLRSGLRRLPDNASLVVIGSVLSRTVDEDFLTAAYAVSKNAVETLVRVAAREGASRGIRVNCVAVGLASTPMAERALNDPRIKDRMPELHPLGGRPVSPGEVADSVAFLLSPAAAPITGATIPADRGWLLR